MDTAETVVLDGKAVVKGTWMKIPFWIRTMVVWPRVMRGVTREESEYLSGRALVQSTR